MHSGRVASRLQVFAQPLQEFTTQDQNRMPVAQPAPKPPPLPPAAPQNTPQPDRAMVATALSKITRAGAKYRCKRLTQRIAEAYLPRWTVLPGEPARIETSERFRILRIGTLERGRSTTG
jgi:uncharacterized membrane protein YccC